MVCKIDFNSKHKNRDIVKVRHHQWSRKIIYDENKKHLNGNYIGALCSQCNFRISEKQRTLPCFGHNAGKYDIKFVIDGITDEKTDVISKPGENYISV